MFPTTLDFTVAIPTFNGAARLPQVLDRLAQQINTGQLRWEVRVMDNNSRDNTQAVVRQYQQNWAGRPYQLHYHFVGEQGAAHARQQAILQAQGNLVGFLDDDNLPEADWIAEAYQFSQNQPQRGAFGSQIHGQSEPGAITDGVNQWLAPYLALINRGETPHRYEPKHKILPPGAGLVVRRQAWLEAVPHRLFLNHSGKSAGLASEDLEAILHIQKAGWEVWYNPNMVVHHQIPKSRLEKDYLVSLFRCIGLSRSYIRLMGMETWQRPLLMPAHIVNDIRKLLIHYLKQPGPTQLTIQQACERQHLQSSLAGPAFLLKKAWGDVYQTSTDRMELPNAQFWLSQIETAFESDHFLLYQQPVLPIATQALATQASVPAHYEVLLRLLQTSESGQTLITPGNFIPTAVRYNLMGTIDRWVIRQFFQQQFQLQHQTAAGQYPSTYAINLSAASVCDRTFISFLQDVLSRYPLATCQLCFEVSESIAIAHLAAITRLGSALAELGCHLAIDGITLKKRAVAQFRTLDLGHLKMSGVATRTLLKHTTPPRLLSDLQQLSQVLQAKVVANCVETQVGLERMKRSHINYAQGFGLAYPEPLLALAPGAGPSAQGPSTPDPRIVSPVKTFPSTYPFECELPTSV